MSAGEHPSTTALATLNTRNGRELGLVRGANVVMPNLTPPQYRVHYEIYPDKACIRETAEACHALPERADRVARPHAGQRPRRFAELPTRSDRPSRAIAAELRIADRDRLKRPRLPARLRDIDVLCH